VLHEISKKRAGSASKLSKCWVKVFEMTVFQALVAHLFIDEVDSATTVTQTGTEKLGLGA